MLINNKLILQQKNPVLLEKLTQYSSVDYEIVPAKNGMNTLVLNMNGQAISYHSRYNPEQEAITLLSNQIKADTKYVLIIGIGLGYIVQQLIEKYPNTRFSIFEPNLTVLNAFLNTFDLKKIRSKNIEFIFSHPSELQSFNKLCTVLAGNQAQILITPVANKLYEEDIRLFLQSFKYYLDTNKKSTVTDLKFQLRWTMNSIINFSEVLSSPNLFNHVPIEKLKDKPALIVAAGPSLDDEIENIRQIKQQGKAYIFAVGSAVNTLIMHNIIPDALFSYDPTAKNAEVVKKIKELQIPIPLIFGSSIGYEVLQQYPGKKVHFLTSQDSIAPNLIEQKSHIIPDAPTVTAVALYILGGIKMAPIMLVGQNLSITKEKTYATGIDYVNRKENSEEKLVSLKEVISTTGETVYTQDSYLAMKKVIEIFIQKVGLMDKIINTTKNGLPIEGAPFVALEKSMELYLKENNIVNNSIFEARNDYNIESALERFQLYENNFDDLISNFKKLIEVDKKIIEAYEKKLITNVQKDFNDFDLYFNRIEKNPFFLQTLAPITRTQYKELVSRSDEVRYERRPLLKMEKYIDIYSKYIRTMYVGIVQIQPAFAELKKSDLFKKEDSQ